MTASTKTWIGFLYVEKWMNSDLEGVSDLGGRPSAPWAWDGCVVGVFGPPNACTAPVVTGRHCLALLCIEAQSPTIRLGSVPR
jgi:hypothetical protein